MSNNAVTTKQENKPVPFSSFMASTSTTKLVQSVIHDKTQRSLFTASIVSAVATTPQLRTCDPASILSAALLGNAIGLAPSPQLGNFYMVPYKTKDGMKAQFILGYKGLIQLAMRTGAFAQINCIDVKEGEIVEPFDYIEERMTIKRIEDDIERSKKKTVGYYAFFKLNEANGGFRKAIWMSYDSMMVHADKYSSAFSLKGMQELQSGKVNESEMWKYSSFWYKDFDTMAFKTMYRKLLSTWAPKATTPSGIALSQAIAADEKEVEITPDGMIVPVDNTQDGEPQEQQNKTKTAGAVVDEIDQRSPMSILLDRAEDMGISVKEFEKIIGRSISDVTSAEEADALVKKTIN